MTPLAELNPEALRNILTQLNEIKAAEGVTALEDLSERDAIAKVVANVSLSKSEGTAEKDVLRRKIIALVTRASNLLTSDDDKALVNGLKGRFSVVDTAKDTTAGKVEEKAPIAIENGKVPAKRCCGTLRDRVSAHCEGFSNRISTLTNGISTLWHKVAPKPSTMSPTAKKLAKVAIAVAFVAVLGAANHYGAFPVIGEKLSVAAGTTSAFFKDTWTSFTANLAPAVAAVDATTASAATGGAAVPPATTAPTIVAAAAAAGA